MNELVVARRLLFLRLPTAACIICTDGLARVVRALRFLDRFGRRTRTDVGNTRPSLDCMVVFRL